MSFKGLDPDATGLQLRQASFLIRTWLMIVMCIASVIKIICRLLLLTVMFRCCIWWWYRSRLCWTV